MTGAATIGSGPDLLRFSASRRTSATHLVAVGASACQRACRMLMVRVSRAHLSSERLCLLHARPSNSLEDAQREPDLRRIAASERETERDCCAVLDRLRASLKSSRLKAGVVRARSRKMPAWRYNSSPSSHEPRLRRSRSVHAVCQPAPGSLEGLFGANTGESGGHTFPPALIHCSSGGWSTIFQCRACEKCERTACKTGSQSRSFLSKPVAGFLSRQSREAGEPVSRCVYVCPTARR